MKSTWPFFLKAEGKQNYPPPPKQGLVPLCWAPWSRRRFCSTRDCPFWDGGGVVTSGRPNCPISSGFPLKRVRERERPVCGGRGAAGEREAALGGARPSPGNGRHVRGRGLGSGPRRAALRLPPAAAQALPRAAQRRHPAAAAQVVRVRMRVRGCPPPRPRRPRPDGPPPPPLQVAAGRAGGAGLRLRPVLRAAPAGALRPGTRERGREGAGAFRLCGFPRGKNRSGMAFPEGVGFPRCHQGTRTSCLGCRSTRDLFVRPKGARPTVQRTRRSK